MAATTANGSSLSDMFNEFNHWRHIIMDISMIGMAITALIATGGASGFLDPILGWAKMHVSGIPDLFINAPEFLSSAFEQAHNGVWFAGADMGSMHDIPEMDHSMHHGM